MNVIKSKGIILATQGSQSPPPHSLLFISAHTPACCFILIYGALPSSPGLSFSSCLESLSEAQAKLFLNGFRCFLFLCPVHFRGERRQPHPVFRENGFEEGPQSVLRAGPPGWPPPHPRPSSGRSRGPQPPRLASELSLHRVHQQVPPPSPYGTLARPRLGFSPTPPPLAEPAGGGEPRGARSADLVRDPASRGPQLNPVTAHARAGGLAGALAPGLTSGPASHTRIRPRSRCGPHSAATPTPLLRPPARTPGSSAGSAQAEGEASAGVAAGGAARGGATWEWASGWAWSWGGAPQEEPEMGVACRES